MADLICRSYFTNPILSTDEPGASKFKMERFLQPGQNAVATVYAPISYPPMPLLVFSKQETTGEFKLVATGALKNCDPDRVVLKRIVLSGYPVKVTKKKAVVRWMFHSPDDVRWFRPVELWTKHGLRGRIKVCLHLDFLYFLSLLAASWLNSDIVSLFGTHIVSWLNSCIDEVLACTWQRLIQRLPQSSPSNSTGHYGIGCNRCKMLPYPSLLLDSVFTV